MKYHNHSGFPMTFFLGIVGGLYCFFLENVAPLIVFIGIGILLDVWRDIEVEFETEPNGEDRKHVELKRKLTRDHIAADVSRMNRPQPYRGFD